MSRVVSAIKMLNYLSLRNIVSLQELSDYLALSERSVQRLRNELEDAGYQIETVKGPGGGYILRQGIDIRAQELSFHQKKLIKQGLSILTKQHGLSLGSNFVDALANISKQLDQDIQTSVPSFQTVSLNLDIEKYQRHMEMIDHAIENHEKIKIEYQKKYNTFRSYTFEPYSMFVVNGMWYLSGYDQENRFINLKISRIDSITYTHQKFRYDDETKKFRGVGQFGYNINPISAIIVVKNMDYISEYIWGDKQTIEWIDDDSFRLSVTFPNEMAFKKFVLSGSANMKIEAPTEFKDWIILEAQKILKLYT
ncbi:YafY family protein [Erysipelothrix urinaevulpis]|uniref:helix-turn-helix transcriptional regulator n=1 Tax=Erysipelothrix urinaevulpis TaxID=2683717 RepID=UPI00135B187E|nr:WYL domain-containing protein [Erysipelothrix urinaevulpis]